MNKIVTQRVLIAVLVFLTVMSAGFTSKRVDASTGNRRFTAREIITSGNALREMNKRCKWCNGTGKCGVCLGSGKNPEKGHGNPVDCPACKGTGVCNMCKGKGDLPDGDFNNW